MENFDDVVNILPHFREKMDLGKRQFLPGKGEGLWKF